MPTDWGRLPDFRPEEFTHPDDVDSYVLYTLQEMRTEANRRRKLRGKDGIIITINKPKGDYRPGDLKVHGKGLALDVVIRNCLTKQPLPVLEQFMIAVQHFWTGVGFYPFWNSPGIHVDMKPLTVWSRRRTWWRDGNDSYEAITSYPYWPWR